METMNLNGSGWRLCWLPNKIQKEIPPYSTTAEIEACEYPKLDVTVPGNFEQDLFLAGVIEDPYFGINTLKLREYEAMHTYYYRTFDFFGDTERAEFRFEGVDTFAEIYLNGVQIAYLDNMLIEHIIKAQGIRRGKNELVVHILPANIVARQYAIPPACNAQTYNYNTLYTRKAAYMSGWDIMPRIVSSGIWRGVSLFERQKDRIDDVFAYTARFLTCEGEPAADLVFHYNLTVSEDLITDYRIKVRGVCEESSFSQETMLWHTGGKLYTRIKNPKLWWPKRYGEPHLYDTAVELWRGDELLDTYTMHVGIRTVKLEHYGVADGNGEFCFIINGKRVFALGVNWVPLDAFPSNHVKRLPRALELLDEAGFNMVRMWGGNVYEHESFFDFCDEHGIMIWQDFSMGCAVYPQEAVFYRMLEKEVRSVIKKYRSHPALVLWAGDNEGDCAYHSWGQVIRDPNKNRVTRKFLPEILEMEDFTRPFLPSSPFCSEEAYRTGTGISLTPEQHLWKHGGEYKDAFHANITASFISEMGTLACPSPASLEKFISADQLIPTEDETFRFQGEDWLVHASCPELVKNGLSYSYRLRAVANQVSALFGIQPADLSMYAKMSQIFQAEAYKFYVENTRIRKPRVTGLLLWNLLDGWPQVSDAMVDYYFCKKLAFSYVKRSSQPLCLMFREPENGSLELFAVSDLQEKKTVIYRVTNGAKGAVLCQGRASVRENSSEPICSIPAIEDERLLYIEWELDGEIHSNHYYTKSQNITFERYIKEITEIGLDQFSGF